MLHDDAESYLHHRITCCGLHFLNGVMPCLSGAYLRTIHSDEGSADAVAIDLTDVRYLLSLFHWKGV